MKTGFVDAQHLILAPAQEYRAVPLRSMILAEAVRRGQEASQSRSFSRAVAVIWSLLEFAPFANAALDAKVSTVLTPGGPLAYRWQTN